MLKNGSITSADLKKLQESRTMYDLIWFNDNKKSCANEEEEQAQIVACYKLKSFIEDNTA